MQIPSQLAHFSDDLSEILLDLLFPRLCCVCHRPENFLCHDCYHGIPFAWQQPTAAEFQLSLGKCYFDQVFILTNYQFPITLLLKSLKYQHAANIAPFLAAMMWQHLALPNIDVITFVPLHPQKKRERGFNQAELLATTLAQRLHKPVLPFVKRVKYLSPQAQVSNQLQRIQRMKEVFELLPEKIDTLTGKRLLLVDDVLTTGATVNAVARELQKTKASQISVAVVASKKT